MKLDPEQLVVIDYTNWRGERALRRIQPQSIQFGTTEWHPKPQWLLVAWDLDREALREFSLSDIHAWSVEPAPA
ncbi:MAG: WYL domain-containing protein [Chlamydiia bacterium]